jgi:crossover junction endodeoxyribonuclease RuvC
MIYGIDLSLTATGFAWCNAVSTPSLETIGFKKLTDEARLAAIVDAVLGRILHPRMVAIEGLALGSKTGLSAERCALHYMVRVALWEAKVPFVIVAPSSLKKFATGSGVGEKSLVIREVYRRWNVEAADDNQADAAALSYVAKAWAGVTPEAELTTFQRDVLKSLRKTQKQPELAQAVGA